MEIWLQSWRDHRRRTGPRVNDVATKMGLLVHEWMIPFPGFFHCENQAIYSVSKEMMKGLCLEELGACAGLSNALVANILHHSHAGNNRAVLFNFACSFIIHVFDRIFEKHCTICEAVSKAHILYIQKKKLFRIISMLQLNRTCTQDHLKPTNPRL